MLYHSRQSVNELHRTDSTCSITQESQCMNYTEQIPRVLSLKTVNACITQNRSTCSVTQDSQCMNYTEQILRVLSLRTVSAWITRNRFYVFYHSGQSVHELHRTDSTCSITQDSQCMNYTEQFRRVLSLRTVFAWMTQRTIQNRNEHTKQKRPFSNQSKQSIVCSHNCSGLLK